MGTSKPAADTYREGEIMPRKNTVPAVLTIINAAEMHPNQRKAIAVWLAKRATDLLENYADYAPVFRARYLPGSDKRKK